VERYSSYSLSAPALDGGEWSASRPGERTTGTHYTGGWVGPRADLDTEATVNFLSPLPGIEPRRPGRLRYAGRRLHTIYDIYA
jgi:hypothetical protein